MKLSRKEFLTLSVTFLGAHLAGCGGEDTTGTVDLSSSGGSNCLQKGTSISIGSNHGHTLTVSVADIQAGAEKTYAIMGTSTHTHSVTLTSSHFADLAANKSVSLVSTSGSGHTHSVSIGCA